MEKTVFTMRNIVFAMLILFAGVVTTGCAWAQRNNNANSKTISVTAFNSLQVKGDVEVSLSYGATPSITVLGATRAINELRVIQNGNRVVIDNSNNKFPRRVKVQITTNDLISLSASGRTKIEARGNFSPSTFNLATSGMSEVEDLFIESPTIVITSSGRSEVDGTFVGSVVATLSGMSKVDMDVRNSSSVVVRNSGSSKCDFKGKTENLTLVASGNSEIDADDVNSNRATVTLSGNAKVEINSPASLGYSLSGNAILKCKGQPQNVVKSVTSGRSKAIFQ